MCVRSIIAVGWTKGGVEEATHFFQFVLSILILCLCGARQTDTHFPFVFSFGSVWIFLHKTKKQNLSDKESSTTIFWQIRDTVHFKGT
jgi:hypothetical protein